MVTKEALISAMAALQYGSLCAGRCGTVIVDPVVFRIPHGGGWDDAVPSGRRLEPGDLQFMPHSVQTLVMSEFAGLDARLPSARPATSWLPVQTTGLG